MKRTHGIPMIVILVTALVLAVTNFRAGTWLLGWDALSPELDIPGNLGRAFFGFWQGNQGLGMLGGHGYSATIPHTLTVGLLSVLGTPPNQIRYVFMLLMLACGAWGMYALSNAVRHAGREDKNQTGPLFAALFYMLGAGTQQMFALPLEAFAVHYAALPWLSYLTIRILDAPSKPLWTAFAAVSFLATVQGFIPPLFIVYLLVIGSICASWLAGHGRARMRVAGIGLVTAAVNLYWLIPLAWFTATRNSEFLQSYNNLLSTPKFADLSVRYGTFADTVLMRGFYLQTVDSVTGTTVNYALGAMRSHFYGPVGVFLGTAFFALAIFGMFRCIGYRKSVFGTGLAVAFFLLFAGLASDTPGFSVFAASLQKIPILAQAFRSGFTKLVLAYGMLMAVFAGMGVDALSQRMRKTGIPPFIATVLAVTSVFAYGFPALTGSLFYGKLRVGIPSAYTELMAYFRTRPEDGRIAYLPTDCPEGWTTYSWGYRGSGFLHYGIRQPILDRAFDVWSRANESFFREIVTALRSGSAKRVDSVLEKYAVSYVVWDPNIGHCSNSKGFSRLETIPEALVSSGTFAKAGTFASDGIAPLTVLSRTDSSMQPVRAWNGTVPNIAPYVPYAERDVAYETRGTYRTQDGIPADAYYPFFSVSGKRGADHGFSVSENGGNLEIRTPLMADLKGYTLNIPKYTDRETLIPVTASATGGVRLDPLLPTVYVGSSGFALRPASMTLDTAAKRGNLPVSLDLRGTHIPLVSGMSRFLLPATTDTAYTIAGSSGTPAGSGKIEPKTVASAAGPAITVPVSGTPDSVAVRFPKITRERAFGTIAVPPKQRICSPEDKPSISSYAASGGSFTASVTNGALCMDYTAPEAPYAAGLVVEIRGTTLSGRPPILRVTGGDVGLTDLEVPVSPGTVSYFAIPPVYESGSGRTITVEVRSRDGHEAGYTLDSLSVWPAPLSFMQSLVFSSANAAPDKATPAPCTSVRESPVSYTVSCPERTMPVTLELPQSYGPEWQAFDVSGCAGFGGGFCRHFPLLGSSYLPHFRMVSWANGWTLPPGPETTIRIVFTPQPLQWLGMIVAPVLLLAVILARNFR